MTHSMSDHITKIKNPDSWPRWPMLPVKKSGLHAPDLGVILFAQDCYIKEGPITVFLTNIHQRITDDTPSEVYSDAEAVVDAGWVVD